MKKQYVFMIAVILAFTAVFVFGPHGFAAETVGDGDVSVIGGLFNFIGEVIAFPFKLLGSIFSGLF